VTDTQPTRNGKRLSHAANSGRHSLKDRGQDLYETPAEAVHALLRVENIPRGIIWEPAAGRGAIVSVLRDRGHAVIASDLIDYGSLDFVRDFLTETQAPAGTEMILTNPPYKDAQQFVEHALKLCPRVIMLMRLAFFESKRRASILDTGQLCCVHVFRDRLPMMHRDGWAGPTASSSMAFAWFCWNASHRGPTVTDRISWKPGPYDATADTWAGVQEAYRTIRSRGGKDWNHTEKEEQPMTEERPKLVAVSAEPQADKEAVPQIDPNNPFANLDVLRNPQSYEEFFGAEATTAFAVRTMK
jgi:hypothetical protein